MEETTFDITEHVLVPVHTILTPEEVAQILAHYNISQRQFPAILDSDPMVKRLGAQPGNVIKIERTSATAGKAVYYRVVIHG